MPGANLAHNIEGATLARVPPRCSLRLTHGDSVTGGAEPHLGEMA